MIFRTHLSNPPSLNLQPPTSGGFTLVEILVGTALFLLVALGAYQAYVGLFHIIDLGQYRVLAVSLANEQFEIARNMPYLDVGIDGGVPDGAIPQSQILTRGGVAFTVESTVRNVDLPFDGTLGGSPNDTSPADNKLLQVTVSCSGCRNMQPITLVGRIAPRNLETASTNGALLVRVFDANGQPVSGADVYVENVATTTTIIINDVTDVNGMLQLIDIPPGTNAYRIIVSKSGYSTDRTYPLNAPTNPFPVKPDATVLLQQVTQVSFAIDLLGSVTFSSVTPSCTAVGGFDFSMSGGKLIGNNLPKYIQSLVTNGLGELSLSNMEWDTYTVTTTDATYDLAGINPLNPFPLNPGIAQAVQLVVAAKDPKSLLVTVKDAASGLPLSDAIVDISGPSVNEQKTTGKGFQSQTNWSGGSGQNMYSITTKYFTDDGNIDVTSTPGDILLTNAFGVYNPSGVLISSTFDTGSVSNFYSFTWNPSSQPALAGSNSVKFQIATATTTSPVDWEYKGPDGTSLTYYTVQNTPIHADHNGDRYLRYKAFLSTADTSVTPNVSDVSFTYSTLCTPPGQVMFGGLASSTYQVSVSKTGYTTAVQSVDTPLDWQELEVVMMP